MWSITVQGSKISRITKGYVIDRTTGNTKGLTGIKGTLVALGEAPSVVSYLPLPVALKRFFGRNRKSPARSSSESPFPFPVMKSLAEQIVSTELGLKSPELLTDDFLYSSPFDGPLTKKEFLATKGCLTDYIADSDIPLKFSNVHLDPFEPDRIWLTFYPKSSNKAYKGAPEVIGVSINIDGLCYKVTAGYIIDRTKSIGSALVGGTYGYKNTSPLGIKSINSISLTIAEAFVSKSATPMKMTPSPMAASKPKDTDTSKPITTSSSVTLSNSRSPTPSVASSKPESSPISFSPSSSAPPATKKPAPKRPQQIAKIQNIAPKTLPKQKSIPSLPSSFSKSSNSTKSQSFLKFSFLAPQVPTSKTVNKQSDMKIDTKKVIEGKKMNVMKAQEKTIERKKLATDKKNLEVHRKKEAEFRLREGNDLKLKAELKVKKSKEKFPTPEKIKSETNSRIPVSTLSKNVVSIITKYKGDVSKVENAVKQFNDNKIQNEKFCREIIGAMGNIDAAVAVLPDIIGSLPRGDRKSKLNQYFQQQL